MDLKSFYKKIDVDSIKNRLPPLPQIKIPKIKSRKIFKSSREDISQQQPPSGMEGGGPPMTPQSLPPPSACIDRTPTRISTVSSLMNINYGLRDKNPPTTTTYRTANNYEAENCPDRPEEYGETASAGGNAATRFGDRCKKTYKDISEFRIKNIFARKTVVKKTEIEVDMYARQYQEELQEEMELDNQIEDRGYQFEFKEARRLMSRSSDSISPPDSLASGVPSPIRSELGRLQRSITPPLLAKKRNTIDEPGPSRVHVQRSMSEESAREPPKKPNRSSLWGLNEKGSTEDTTGSQSMYKAGISKLGAFRKSRKEGVSSEVGTAPTENVWKLKSIRARFATDDSGAEEKPKKSLHPQETIDEPSDHENKGWKFSNIHLKHTERHTDASEKNIESHGSSPEGKFSGIKESIKRLKQRKPRQETSDDSEHEQSEEPTTSRANVSDQLKAGLRRLRLRDRSFTFDEDETKPPEATATTNSATTTNKLRNWKKSFKVKRPSESGTDDEAPTKPMPAHPARSSTLMRKLNHIRSRKVGSEDGEESGDPTQTDENANQQKPKSSNLEKLEQARDKALRKVNAQVQKMKMFHGKSRDSPTESSPEKPRRTNHKKLDSGGVVAEIPKTTPAVWTTNKSMSESLESDDEVEIPRVLIHQDNSDQYESTLIIAVTRPAPPAPPAPTTVIKEIIPKPKPKPKSEWIPNKNAISSFLEMTPSPPSSSQHHLDVNRGHFRKRSMDSNDSDSWIPENFRNKSCTSSASAGLNKISENSEPWKVHSVFSEEKLYKTKSIDIFSHREGSAFQDFDDEMKNVPVRRIAATSADSLDKSFGESTDDDDDYDNASRITRVKRPSPMVSTKVSIETVRSESVTTKGSIDSNKACYGSPLIAKKGQIGNSQESLDANYDENEELSSDDEDGPPTMAPSPPPSFSPPPPPLPLRKPPRNIPERNDSMVRLAKPLVKQASLRRHFSEEIEPSDLGKVNKLICRFEKNPSQENVQCIETIIDDSNEADVEVEEKKPTKTKDDGKDSKNGNKKRPAPVPKQPEIVFKIGDDTKNNNNARPQDTPTLEIITSKNLDSISAAQSPRSEYGSPIGSVCLSERTSSEYGSPIGMAYPTKTMHAVRRLSNRSSLRDDDTFYSFESDEENNFYSFGESSTSSTRYTIEI